MRAVLALVAMPLLAAPLVAAADSPSTGEDDYWVKPIVVTATRSEMELTNLASSVAVITEAEIRRSPAQTLDDLLRQIPGFSTLRQSSSLTSAPLAQSVSLRGLGGTSASRTLVLVDGVPIVDPFASWVAWNRVFLENIERIEVVRGGGSGTWGNLAMGGVINIIMKRPTERTVRLMGEWGKYWTGQGSLLVADRIGSWIWSGGGRFYDSDGFIVTRSDQVGPVDQPAGIRHGTVQGRLERRFSGDRSSAYVEGSYYDEEKRKGTPGDDSGLVARRVVAGADFVTADGSAWDLNLFGETQNTDNYTSSISPDRTRATPSSWSIDVPSTSLGANAQWSREFGERHHLFAGSDYRYIDSKSVDLEEYRDGRFQSRAEIGGKQHVVGAYVQEIFTPTPRWTATLSARFDYLRNSDGYQRQTDLETDVIEREELFGAEETTAFDPTIGLVFHANDRLSFRGSAYRGFRAPTVSELYRRSTARGNVTNAPNPGLEPERLTGGEIGSDYKVGSKLLCRVTGFWNEVENTIAQRTIAEADADGDTIEPCGWIPDGGVCRQRDNIGKLLSAGVETEITYRPARLWAFSASHIFDHTEILESDDPELVGKRQRQAPRHQIVLKASCDDHRIAALSLQGRYVGVAYDDDVNDLPACDFFVVDLHLSREFREEGEFFLAVENLLDREYEVRRSTTGYVEVGPPLQIRGGVRARL